MAEPGLPDSTLLPENHFHSEGADSTEQSLWTELNVLRSQFQGQRERIHHLEQALDQSLSFQAELRAQLVHQQFLESQLASTEEIANIQQQAITHLKQQLAQQGQQQAVQQRGRMGQNSAESAHPFPLLRSTETLLQQQTLIQDRTLIQAALITQESEAMRDFSQKLSEKDASIHQLETELHRAHIALQEQQAMIDAFQAYTVRRSSGDLADVSLDAELFAAFGKIQELETQLSKQTTSQAMLQHVCQELEQTRDRTQTRVADLERQTADMQEQILQQAQQASEYEAAVQHWKDRYHNLQNSLNQVKHLLEQAIPNSTSPLSDLLTALQDVTNNTTDTPSPNVARNLNVDLPDFLIRRHRYRTRP